MNTHRQNLIAQIKKIVNLGGHMDTEAASERIQASIPFRGPNVWILACSILIASAGLSINSTAVIIGAMLISPLMGPIIGIGLSLGTGDAKLLRFSALNLAVMVIASLLFSTLFYIISPLEPVTPTELEARTSPTIYDVLIALFGGFAGILENSRKEHGTVLSGVAIATALMPPLCTAGYGISHLSWHFFGGAMFLFLINAVFIILATYLIVKYLRFEPVGQLGKFSSRRGRGITSSLLVAIVAVSLIAAFQMVRENNFERKVNHFVNDHKIIEGSYIYDHQFGPKRTVTISVAGEPMSDEAWVAFWEDARKAGLGKDQITLHQNTRSMTKDQILLLIHDLHGETDLALKAKDEQISTLSRQLDSLLSRQAELTRRQDSLTAILRQQGERPEEELEKDAAEKP
ncbi:MAG: DUF389 domain-containing protein [Bacteroidales bacterium]|nr:DUF389 domain-containing protein [Bacteroidales bacterium]